jgi:hypothetical protein
VSSRSARYTAPVLRAPPRAMALAVLGMLAGGCSLLIDLAGTTGGSASGAGSEAGREEGGPGGEGSAPGDGAAPQADGDGVRAEAGSDGGPVSADDGAAADVSPDAGRPPYPPGSWCATNAPALFFCDDLDDGALGSRWTGSTLQVAGAATLSTTNAHSPPQGFDIACPALMPSTFLTEALTESIPASSRVALAFDFDPLTFPADGQGGTLYLATMTQGPGTPRSAIQFRAGTALTDLQEQVILESGAIKVGTGQWESATHVQVGTWTRVEMDIDFTTSPATVALLLGGQSVATGTLDPSWTRATSTFYLGDWYIPGEPAFHVAYDNVTIAVQP